MLLNYSYGQITAIQLYSVTKGNNKDYYGLYYLLLLKICRRQNLKLLVKVAGVTKHYSVTKSNNKDYYGLHYLLPLKICRRQMVGIVGTRRGVDKRK